MIKEFILWLGSVLGFGKLAAFSSIGSLFGTTGRGTDSSGNPREEIIKLHITIDNALVQGQFEEAANAWHQANRILIDNQVHIDPGATSLLERHDHFRIKILGR